MFKNMRTIKMNLKDYTKEAIGYLTTWCIDSYDTLELWNEFGSKNICSNYTNSKSDMKYFIMAVWEETTMSYSFHS